jgi:hypothetical protein
MQEPNLDYFTNLAEGDNAFTLKMTSILKKEFPLEMALF